MTDFFDDLERQLVAATPQRPALIRRARRQRAAAVAGALVVLLAGGAGIATAVGGSGEDRASTPLAPTGEATATAPTTTSAISGPSDPRTSPIAILNGTTTPGLARGVANQLQNQGYKIGNVTNAASQGHTMTTVFLRAQRDIPLATQIASALRLGDVQGEFALRQMPEGVKVIAGRSARVAVLVGSDQNRPAGP
ncbi:LytR C-terminal domain-containing protein [Baekduia sp. Peel2402]|uniref:LytR C-terminal domain-containing protein n=1 Tax=Baekduia sp. Peel2402 TaxID=3458296 RepID=UPI00403E5AC1